MDYIKRPRSQLNLTKTTSPVFKFYEDMYVVGKKIEFGNKTGSK